MSDELIAAVEKAGTEGKLLESTVGNMLASPITVKVHFMQMVWLKTG